MQLSAPSHAFARALPLWGQLAASGALGRRRGFGDRHVLCIEQLRADRGWFVASGQVELFQESADGWALVTKICKAPALVGVLEVTAHEPSFLESARVLSDAQVFEIPRPLLEALVAQRSDLARECLLAVSRNFATATRLERARLFDAPVALANHLLALAELFGRPCGAGVLIDLDRSQAELASAVGVALRSVARTLRTWRTQGLISTHRGRFVLPRPKALQSLAAPLAGSLIVDLSR